LDGFPVEAPVLKSLARFTGVVIVGQMITYFIAGILAQQVLGAADFYPPSPTALSYLRNPSDPDVFRWVLPAQAVRGLLFGLVLFPFRQRIVELGPLNGGLVVAGAVFVLGYVAASGGLIEHWVFFTEYPSRFAAITFVEVLIQAVVLGYIVARFAVRRLATVQGKGSPR